MKSGISLMASGIFLAILLTGQSGCNNGPDLRDVYTTNIKKLHACYIMYMEEHEFVGPKDEAEFKKYLKTDPTAIFLIKNVDLTPENVDEIFIGDRDGEPLVVRYGLKGEADHACVFEAKGLDGQRFVALANLAEYGDQEYDDFLSGKTKPETAQGAGADAFDEELTDQTSDASE